MTQRTPQQNKSHWTYCEIMSEGLNNTAASVQMVCRLPISWTKDNFHELIWKPVQNAMYPEITSTTQLDTKQMSEVYRQVDKIISDEWEVSSAWPSLDEQLNQARVRE